MRYKIHRIAPNSEGWRRPSFGRLGRSGVGDYVNKHGFGHEDWNFNFDLAVEGNMLGYTVANPAKKYIGEKFGLVLATYDAGGWRAAGYYKGAKYVEASDVELSQSWIDQMASDVFDLAGNGQTHVRYQRMSMDEVAKAIPKDFTFFNWHVPIEQVHVFRQPLPIPKNLFDPGRQRMVTSYDLTEAQFKAITKIEPGFSRDKSECEEEEGEKTLKLHKKSERSARLVAAFKANLESYACSVCGFEFENVYGDLGTAFIECHHTKPISQMKPGDKTKVGDLCAVCSNCHRMLHRSNPMLTPSQLRERFRRAAA